MRIKRRQFLQGCCAGIAAMSGVRVSNLSFAQSPGSNQKIIINVFLRGGMDALNFLIPYADALYHDARQRIAIDASDGAIDVDGYFALHPQAAALKDIYDSQHLALIPATGIPDEQGTRSHFQAQDYLEFGGPQQNEGGWLGRYLNGIAPPPEFSGIFRGLSISSSTALSLAGFSGALSLNDADSFTIQGNANDGDIRAALRTMYGPDPELAEPAMKTLDAIDLLDANPIGNYTPRPGVQYPDDDFAEALKGLAQVIKLGMGLQAATIDLGGWDTHENQTYGDPEAGPYADRVADLVGGLEAFWADIADNHNDVTIVVMSEFGRRLNENANRGTDHGHGGLMMVLNGGIREKKVYGDWPGLATDQLYERKDLKVTTDFRQVLGEILISQTGIKSWQIGDYFPGYSFPGPVGFLLEESARSDVMMVR